MAVRSRTSKLAHLLERTGLATAGASCGLFVAAHLVRAGLPAMTSVGFVLVLMLCGALGFYLGIDLPARAADADSADAAEKTDPVETLSALGTFLAPVAALVSVGNIVLDLEPRPGWVIAIAACWLLGVTMQIAAGVIARIGR
jgi:hypothetical protein